MQFEEEEAGVRVVLQDGSTELFSVLIGADGLNSRIRAMLIQDGPPRSAQQDAWVGVARGLEWASNLETTVGSLGRGLRFWHVPLNRSTAYWYGILDTRLLPQTPQSLLELKQIFRGWHAPIPELIAATAPVDVIKTPIRDRIPIQHWGKGRITLLGDAAHPVTPDLGQGACQALESAAVLAVELLQQGPCIGALQSYARTRQPRAAGVTRLSYLSSRSTMPLNSSLCGLRDLALTISPKEVPLLQLGWLFGLAE
jgi:2-polyprenyl-6-methoxyphenol hydroxylase-like FAD-dependent oxidoreductase